MIFCGSQNVYKLPLGDLLKGGHLETVEMEN